MTASRLYARQLEDQGSDPHIYRAYPGSLFKLVPRELPIELSILSEKLNLLSFSLLQVLPQGRFVPFGLSSGVFSSWAPRPPRLSIQILGMPLDFASSNHRPLSPFATGANRFSVSSLAVQYRETLLIYQVHEAIAVYRRCAS